MAKKRGRKKGVSETEELLRAELSKALKAAIGEKRGNITAAAKSIGISKQTLSLYIRRKATPGAEILRKICAQWNLQLNIHGALVDASGPAEKTPERAEQLFLFEAIAQVEDSGLQVAVLRRLDESIDLKVTINFGGPKGA
jgi:hypothetical protein